MKCKSCLGGGEVLYIILLIVDLLYIIHAHSYHFNKYINKQSIWKSEARSPSIASEFLENIEEMFPWLHIHIDVLAGSKYTIVYP